MNPVGVRGSPASRRFMQQSHNQGKGRINLTRCIILSGNGRSGSNRLLDILDQSTETVCRNEVNAISGGDFNAIKGAIFDDELPPSARQSLDVAIAKAPYRRSARDRFDQLDKDFLGPGATAGQWLLSKSKLRRALAQFGLLEGSKEWPVPRLYLDAEKVRHAKLVLKLNACPAWTVALHDTDQSVRVIHNIRNPQDYLNSWFNRFAIGANLSIFRSKIQDVPKIFDYFGAVYPDRLSVLSHEHLVEIELWRWRYVNERLYNGLKGSDRCAIVTYSEIERDPIKAAERILHFSEIPLDTSTKRKIAEISNTLFVKPHTEHLDEKLCNRLMDEILGDSPLLQIPF